MHPVDGFADLLSGHHIRYAAYRPHLAVFGKRDSEFHAIAEDEQSMAVRPLGSRALGSSRVLRLAGSALASSVTSMGCCFAGSECNARTRGSSPRHQSGVRGRGSDELSQPVFNSGPETQAVKIGAGAGILRIAPRLNLGIGSIFHTSDRDRQPSPPGRHRPCCRRVWRRAGWERQMPNTQIAGKKNNVSKHIFWNQRCNEKQGN